MVRTDSSAETMAVAAIAHVDVDAETKAVWAHHAIAAMITIVAVAVVVNLNAANLFTAK